MTLSFTPWPAELQKRYTEKGYWQNRVLTQSLRERAAQTPEATAIICGARQLSYQEVDQRSDALAARLTARGLGPGDSALVQLPNVAEFYLVFFALLKAGIAPVNALIKHQRSELLSYAEQLKPRLVIGAAAHPLFARGAFLKELQTRNLSPDLFLCLDGAQGDTRLDTWLLPMQDACPTPVPTAPNGVAFFLLSGGSTGTPKLIPRTHNDYDYNIRASAAVCALGTGTRYLCAIPASHNFALSAPGALGVLHAGGTVVLAATPDPAECFPLIEQHRVTMVALVPPAAALWVDTAPTQDADLSSLQLVQVGGASFAPDLARKLPAALGCQLQQVFGMAEGLLNYTRPDDPDHLRFTTQGYPLSPDDEIKILDETGQPVADETPGALATRGPYTFRGYYQSPEQNAKSFDSEGFYYSGDLVERTKEGYLRVVGRIKDQINRGGEKIASEEIEHLAMTHPGILQAALVSYPDLRMGEKSCLFVVSSDPELKTIPVKKHLMQIGIADYKLPDQVLFQPDLPLTAVGKIDKQTLRRIAKDRLTAPQPVQERADA